VIVYHCSYEKLFGISGKNSVGLHLTKPKREPHTHWQSLMDLQKSICAYCGIKRPKTIPIPITYTHRTINNTLLRPSWDTNLGISDSRCCLAPRIFVALWSQVLWSHTGTI